MAHPVKAQILAELGTETAQSAAELAGRIGMPVRSVRHQLSRLAAEGLVEVTASRERRGALEKLYRMSAVAELETVDYEEMAPDEARGVTTEILRRIVMDFTRSLLADTFNLNDSCEIRIGAEVDEKGWTEIGGIMRRAWVDVEAARARAAVRLDRTREDPRHCVSTLLWFERPAPGDMDWDSSPSSGRRLLPSVSGSMTSSALVSAALAEAMGHPLRAKILYALSDTHPLGVAQLAEWIHESKGKVRHHVNRLVTDGLIEALPGAGRTRTRYALLVIPLLGEDDLAQLTPPETKRIGTEIFRRIVVDAVGAISAGTFYRRPDFYEVRLPVAVDARGWKEIQEISLQTFEKVERSHATATARLAESKERPITATATILLFELPPI